MALKDLLIAVKTAIVNNPSITVSNIHLFQNDNEGDYDPDDFPFINIESISSGANDVDTGRSDIVDNYDISFKTFSKDAKISLDIGNELQKMFIVSDFSLTDGTVMCVQKFSETNDLDPDKDVKGNNIYFNMMVMSFMVNFNLT